MSYKVALDKAWGRLKEIDRGDRFEVRFLADEYNVDLASGKVLSLSCNVPPHEHIAVIVMHYLIKKLEGMPKVTGKWISFQELPGGQGYYDAFKKRAVDPIIRKYGENPEGLISCLGKLPGRKTQHGDSGVVLDAFENVPILITVWGKDEEFSADANIHFDESISRFFCTEDIAVLADIVSRQI